MHVSLGAASTRDGLGRCTESISRSSSSARVTSAAAAFASQRAIWIDAGTRDDWYLDLGATAFRNELAKIGVTDVKFELFEAAHMGIDYRYAQSLAYLAARLG